MGGIEWREGRGKLGWDIIYETINFKKRIRAHLLSYESSHEKKMGKLHQQEIFKYIKHQEKGSGRGLLYISWEEGVEFPVNRNGAKEKKGQKTGRGNTGSTLPNTLHGHADSTQTDAPWGASTYDTLSSICTAPQKRLTFCRWDKRTPVREDKGLVPPFVVELLHLLSGNCSLAPPTHQDDPCDHCNLHTISSQQMTKPRVTVKSSLLKASGYPGQSPSTLLTLFSRP